MVYQFVWGQSNLTLRIGVIAEGQAELGHSIPYIKPQDGGKAISQVQEGALHTLIRRELARAGFLDCVFVQRHPSLSEKRGQRRTGHGILDRKYLAQVVSVWKASEVDMIVLLVDADEQVAKRQDELDRALQTIGRFHFDVNGELCSDQHAGGLAIRQFDTWLLADSQTVERFLGVALPVLPDDLETLPAQGEASAKGVLETAVSHSTFLPHEKEGERKLQAKWQLAFLLDLNSIRQRCQQGYAPFVDAVQQAASNFAHKQQ